MKRLALLLGLTLLACGGKSKPTPAPPAPALTPAVVTLTVLNATAFTPYGTPLTLFATVTDNATGTVTFLDGTDPLGTAPVGGTAGSWGASLTVTLSIGPHSLTADYSGDTTFATATSRPPEPETMVPTNAPASFVLASSLTPSPAGQAVTFTATLAFSGVATSLITGIGSVTFMDGSTVLASEAPIASGLATCTVSGLTAGTHTITAIYTPQLPTITPVTSNAVSQVISPA